MRKLNNIGWRKAQKGILDDTKRHAWKLLVKDKVTNLLKCTGRIQGYKPLYLEETHSARPRPNKALGGGQHNGSFAARMVDTSAPNTSEEGDT